MKDTENGNEVFEAGGERCWSNPFPKGTRRIATHHSPTFDGYIEDQPHSGRGAENNNIAIRVAILSSIGLPCPERCGGWQ